MTIELSSSEQGHLAKLMVLVEGQSESKGASHSPNS